jgi:hypothetical protein
MDALIPSRVLRALMRGSHEAQIQEATLAAQAAHGRFGVEEDAVQVIATFSRHALVLAENKIHRLTLSALDEGGLSVVESEEVDVPTFETVDEVQDFFESSAQDAVSALIEGDKETCRALIGELVEGASFIAAPDPLHEMKEVLDGLFSGDRPWRMVYEANGSSIHRFLWGASGVAHRDSPRAKYLGLYGGDQIEEAQGYHSAVHSDLGVISDKLTTLWEHYQTAFGKFIEDDSGFEDLAVAGVGENFRQFAEDFGQELSVVCRLMEQASKDEDVETVRARAMLYDHVARQYPTLDIACRLIKRTADDITGKTGA